MNNNITSFLNEYVMNPDPQYAVMLNGKWGCGKTYFVKKWLDEYKGIKDENTLLPVYVSLFGLRTTKQINEAIDRQVHPILNSTIVKVGKGILKFASQAAFKTTFDFNEDGKDETEVNWSVDTLSLFSSDDEEVKGFRLLVFDDFERCNVDIKELLGYINFFVEQCRCKVIIVCDETKITDKDDKRVVFNDFKEKTIGRTFAIETNIKEAVESFVTETPCNPFLQANEIKTLIVDAFKATGVDNLRVLKQTLQDFVSLLNRVEDELVTEDQHFFSYLLVVYIVMYAEFKSGAKEILENWSVNEHRNLYGASRTDGSDPRQQEINALKGKYASLDQEIGEYILHPSFVSTIILSIKTGCDLSTWVCNTVKARINLPLTQKIENWTNMTDEELEKTYSEVVNLLVSSKPLQLAQYFALVEWLLAINYWGVKDVNTEAINAAKDKIRKIVCSTESATELYKIRSIAAQGLATYNYKDGEVDELNKWFWPVWNEAIKTAKDPYTELLEDLNDNNVLHLSEMDRQATPNHQKGYNMVSVLDKVDIEKHVKSILSLSNYSLNIYGLYLVTRYHVGYQQKLEEYFIDDIGPLKKEKSLLENAIPTTSKLKAFNIRRIINDIDKILEMGKDYITSPAGKDGSETITGK